VELIGAAIVVSLAYVYAPVLRVHAARRTRVALPAGAAAPGADPVPAPPPELPAAVEKWCDAWMDQDTRDEARETARILFAEHGNWDVVLGEMERTCR
jgi:hypothetical protein